MLEVRDLTVKFGSVEALAGVTLKPESGRTTVLIGPSGCGKSTLLRALIGLNTPSAGEVLVDGETLAPARLESIRRRVGYVIQEGGLFPHLSAEQNVTLMARHLNRDGIPERVAELAALVQLEPDMLKRHPAKLSGGQRQRVSLMRALMLEPEVLLLDEPLGALDPMVRAELQGDLREIFRRLNKTVIMVTHDLAEAAYFGDSIVLLRDGRVVQQGSFDDLSNKPAEDFVREFVTAQRKLHSVGESA
jgi:osmoprotectant transport system ATP-binding protein